MNNQLIKYFKIFILWNITLVNRFVFAWKRSVLLAVIGLLFLTLSHDKKFEWTFDVLAS